MLKETNKNITDMKTNFRDQRVAALAIEAVKVFYSDSEASKIQRVQSMGNDVDFATKEDPKAYEDWYHFYLKIKKVKELGYSFGRVYKDEKEAKEIANKLGVKARKFIHDFTSESRWVVYTKPKK